MKTCREAAQEWGMAERTVSGLCATSKIPGAVKKGKSWQLPDDARKPVDGRVKTGKYIHAGVTERKKALPIGISNYVRAQSEYYYVDKTLLIKEFLDKKPLLTLFIRPHRFGKTLNMDMLRVFFESSDIDTSFYFQDKEIWKCGKEYISQQGKYPVIFLSFKDVKCDSWESALGKLAGVIQAEFSRHKELQNSTRLAAYETEFLRKILEGRANETELSSSLGALSKMLDEHHGIGPMIMIDEYDTPLQEGYSSGYYSKITNFMRGLFTGGFKDNPHLTYGFLTGILYVAQERIFDGLPNLAVNSILDHDYSSFFGFTVPEINQLLRHYGAFDKGDELKSWYGGYFAGNREIYNPWSVINYFFQNSIAQPYWIGSGKSELLEEVLNLSTEGSMEKLYLLLQGKTVVARIHQTMADRSLKENPANIDSMLLLSGYLKVTEEEKQEDGAYLCRISIPNREIAAVFKSELLRYLLQSGMIARTTADKIMESLFTNHLEKLQMTIAEYLDHAISYHNFNQEDFYYAFTLGLMVLLDNHYKLESGLEVGNGCFALCLYPKNIKYPGIIMTLKSENGLTEERLKNLARESVGQVAEKSYAAEMKKSGVTKILKIGAAFSGKKVKIKFE